MIPREVKRDLYDKVVIPTLVYGFETWPLSGQERSKIVESLFTLLGLETELDVDFEEKAHVDRKVSGIVSKLFDSVKLRKIQDTDQDLVRAKVALLHSSVGDSHGLPFEYRRYRKNLQVDEGILLYGRLNTHRVCVVPFQALV